jgi:hypothetical protein
MRADTFYHTVAPTILSTTSPVDLADMSITGECPHSG